MNKLKEIKLMGLSLPAYLVVFGILVASIALNILPNGMIGALAVMMIFGALFQIVGNNTPIVRTYLGGGAIVCIFASAFLVYFNIMPEAVIENVNTFMSSNGFLNFYIAALITGSILGMNRKLLINASVRFLPVALCAMTFAILAVGIVGMLVGHGFVESIMYIAIPMMGGGMGAGVVPLSNMYAQATGGDAAQLISVMIPASTLGNVMAIVGAGLLAKAATFKPSWNGNGKLVRTADSSLEETINSTLDYGKLGTGLVLSLSYFTLGTILGHFVPAIHSYAWMIIAVAVSKALDIIPKELEESAHQWGQFVMKNLTSALLVGIGLTMIDLHAVIQSISPIYILLVAVVVICVSIGAGIGGKFVGFYQIESAITAGLCTTNMGGTGDVAVLSAADRMELLPFAQIATRICGALVLIVASILVKVFF